MTIQNNAIYIILCMHRQTKEKTKAKKYATVLVTVWMIMSDELQ